MHIIRISSCLLFIILGLYANNVKSAQSSYINIIWATDTWEGFTSRDGTGIYHEIFTKVFEQSPYKISIEYLPWKRALHQVEINKAHISGALPKSNKYLFADMPILTQPLSIITHIKKPLNLESIKALVGVWPISYVEQLMQSDISPYLNGITAQYRSDAMALLQNNKVDYYLDIRAQLEFHLTTLPKKEQSNYYIQDLSTLNLYLIFSNDDKGRSLKKYYDETTKHLLEENILQPIYKKYNLNIEINESLAEINNN